MSKIKGDWAEQLAAEILAEQKRFGGSKAFPQALATTLRTLRHRAFTEGHDDGRKTAWAAIHRVRGAPLSVTVARINEVTREGV